MKEPSIRHDVRDEDRNITFCVLAYRKLTPLEVHQMVWAFESMGHEVLPNHDYDIVTVLGATD